MAKIEKKGNTYELDGRLLHNGSQLRYLHPMGGTMIVTFKWAGPGCEPEIWDVRVPLLQAGQERFQKTGEVPDVEDAMRPMGPEALLAEYELII